MAITKPRIGEYRSSCAGCYLSYWCRNRTATVTQESIRWKARRTAGNAERGARSGARPLWPFHSGSRTHPVIDGTPQSILALTFADPNTTQRVDKPNLAGLGIEWAA